LEVIALYSIKGGVGKTATAANLAYMAAQDGFRTILLDLDPQGSVSFYFRMKSPKSFKAKHFIKGGKQFTRSIKGTDFENLDVLPSNLSYKNLDLRLNNLKKSKKRLRETLNQFKGDYDLVFLDCPPNINLVSENIFHAADILLVPVIPTTLSLLTYRQLVKFFGRCKMDKSKITVFFSMVEKRKNLHREIMDDFSQKNNRVLKSYIPYNSLIERMGLAREPVGSSRPNSSAARAYLELWEEVQTVCIRDHGKSNQ
jgi:cellulose biosynthesis protein BcsQ